MRLMPLRRSFLLSCAAAVLAGCASEPPQPEAEPSLAQASLPVQLLMTEGFVPVHRALGGQLMIPTQIRAEPGYGAPHVVVQELTPYLQQARCVDLVLAPRPVLQLLQAHGLVRPGRLYDVVRSPLIAIVQASRPLPVLKDTEDAKQMLEAARSIAYPSADGSDFIEQKLFRELDLSAKVLPKSIKVFGPQVAQLVARGDAELGLLLRSELPRSAEVQVVGKIPHPLAYEAVYSAGIAGQACSTAGAQLLARFYQREAAMHDWNGSGWEPVAGVSQPPPPPVEHLDPAEYQP
ncbi:substrate-binding domain-containing protein [Comamonas sediminis]|uniref:substrate-binding domain-containing protein n=1 Tax=Comamonas sediminis TaxID=1783360 RepID=UPI003D2DBB67